jgi:predicted secreted protein
MAGLPVKNAGTKIFISGAPGAAASVLIDGVSDISGFGVTRKEIDVTALSDKWRRRLKGLKDGGSVELSGQFRSDDLGQKYLAQAVGSEAAWGFRVEIPDTKGTNNSQWVFYGQVMSYEPSSGKVDGVVEFKAQIMIDNAITFTAAA